MIEPAIRIDSVGTMVIAWWIQPKLDMFINWLENVNQTQQGSKWSTGVLVRRLMCNGSCALRLMIIWTAFHPDLFIIGLKSQNPNPAQS